MATALNNVLEALVNVWPVATVKPPLKVPSPVKVLELVTAKVPPSDVEPLPTLKLFVPVTLVAPFRLTLPVPVEKVPLPVCEKELLLATVKPPLNVPRPVRVDVPVTARLPPRLVAPVPTVKVLEPVIEVTPFSDTAPVPVPNDPEPV
jgi:hypothetical protein